MQDEKAIIQRVLNGDVEAFRQIVERYQGPVIRMIGRFIRDKHACEDVGQEVFLAAYKRIGSFDPARGQFLTWLLAIARNLSRNALKKRSVPSTAELPERVHCLEPCDEAAKNEFYRRLDEALAALPDEQRLAFILAEVEGLAYQQIADIEAVPIGTIRSRINRAKSALRSLLAEEDGGLG
ncbi:MAG: sigma-70 family RNA polymerase sigma factor [Phycisphaerae bacterium]|jgi:RNA polymerase sigma-70 factor (ECF subfamily)